VPELRQDPARALSAREVLTRSDGAVWAKS
jgi:hypothetical protein